MVFKFGESKARTCAGLLTMKRYNADSERLIPFSESV